MKKSRFITNVLLPIIASFIWGTAFTAQALAADYIPPFYINALRSFFAVAVLFVVCLFIKKKNPLGKAKDLIIGSLVCGICLYAAVNLQQIGIQQGTDSGKAGFITALYAVIVPIMEIFLHKKVSLKTWIAIAISVMGLYLLCITSSFTIEASDAYIVGAAFFFALQIIALDYFTNKVNAVALSCGQFLITGVLSLVTALFTETISLPNIVTCLPELLYMAVFSSCIAYTFQVISLRDGNPSVVSLLFCLESVFAVLAGVIILGEKLSQREILGCILMLGGVVLSQIHKIETKEE